MRGTEAGNRGGTEKETKGELMRDKEEEDRGRGGGTSKGY